MQDYKRLVAEEYFLLQLLSRGADLIEADKLTGKEAEKALRYMKTFYKRSTLLKRDLPAWLTESKEGSLLGGVLELKSELVEADITFRGGKVLIKEGLNTISIEPTYSLELLTINRLIKDGYLFEEVLGSHYNCYIKQMSYATTAYSCNCREFIKDKQCDHIVAIKGFREYRSALSLKGQKRH